MAKRATFSYINWAECFEKGLKNSELTTETRKKNHWVKCGQDVFKGQRKKAVIVVII